MGSGDSQWSTAATQALRAAGWHEGRRVDVGAWQRRLESEGFVMHSAARAFLIEFGGLTVRASGPGREFGRLSFNLDPTLCSGQKGWLDSLSGSTAGQLFPVGEEADGNASIAIDVDGVVYLLFNFEIMRIGPDRTAPARLIDGEREH